MQTAQEYLLPELSTLKASLGLDMSSQTAEQYTHYISSLRYIIRHLPDEWRSEVRSYVSMNPYCGPRDILVKLDEEIRQHALGSERFEVLTSIRSFASQLDVAREAMAEASRS